MGKLEDRLARLTDLKLSMPNSLVGAYLKSAGKPSGVKGFPLVNEEDSLMLADTMRSPNAIAFDQFAEKPLGLFPDQQGAIFEEGVDKIAKGANISRQEALDLLEAHEKTHRGQVDPSNYRHLNTAETGNKGYFPSDSKYLNDPSGLETNLIEGYSPSNRAAEREAFGAEGEVYRINRLRDALAQKKWAFDPRGAGYDEMGAMLSNSPMTIDPNDLRFHRPSLGMGVGNEYQYINPVLKGAGHDTYWKHQAIEDMMGNIPTTNPQTGRKFSVRL